ncbi:cation:proton antiporter [Synechococcus sp. CS-602]|uniref:cation:proton antiporter n=1 Tax=Synechococcaceae TaxID=1890426 RepID=UPI0008FF37DD|nr:MULTISPECIES: cation:proton antiporter [Synechococcaceae]MCT4365955.1 cation:proton antiporter [Candidatus Regnicoccus frigidus MAG-AL1]APD48823.1 sodium:proton exchanger [Synechococcus sp. SynAce01]MCT0202438.1 cation:proton antiporter [Synechococcus sp. CS-603]MCT0205617.1 cation:proton antiporter [Synechococcus sp. CS-602]MCT0245152.1 cation:proton antiporter [Synechococcus sp. CS-601]
MLTIESIELLLLVAAVVAMLARRLRLPYSVGLVLGGIVLAWLPFAPDLSLTRELIFNAFLPPLIFEAALYIAWPALRKDLPVVLTLATLGVVLSVGVTTLGMHYWAHWSWPAALLFGVLISATDPVSVIATFKEAGVHGRLRALVEAESLLNDSTAAVGFSVAIALATGAAITPLGTVQFLAVTIVGGVACGGAVAAAVLALAGRTEDPLVEITFTTIAAYGSFWLAEYLDVSGVLATLTAGIMMGNLGPLGAISPKGREAVVSFWDYAAFVVNSLIFLLMGMLEAHQNFTEVLLPIGIAIVLVTAGRALSTYLCCSLFLGSALKVKTSHQHVLFWGGLRGALALALSLGLPTTLPYRDAVVTVAFAVVAYSVIVQGLSITPLMRALGEIGPASADNLGEASPEASG